MANVLPKPIPDRIQWCEDHVAGWTTNAVAMGSTVAAVTDFETKTEAARAALLARNAAENAARDANNNLRLAVTAMTDAAAGIIKSVKGKADVAGDSVYSLASIPVPATPSPRPMPGEPSDFAVELAVDGTITLKWKCDNSGNSGTQYQVWRRIDGDAAGFTFVGGTGEKKFVDSTIPAGSAQVTYQVRATRPTGAGPWAQWNVNFGTTPTGAATASVTAAPKIAA